LKSQRYSDVAANPLSYVPTPTKVPKILLLATTSHAVSLLPWASQVSRADAPPHSTLGGYGASTLAEVVVQTGVPRFHFEALKKPHGRAPNYSSIKLMPAAPAGTDEDSSRLAYLLVNP